jgi:hypothetical protein
MTDTIRAALEAAAKRLCICDGDCFETRHGMMHGPCERKMGKTAAAVAAFLRALPRDWRDIMRHETQWRIPAITGWTEDTTRDGPETAAHWHAMRLAAAVEEAAQEAGDA